MRRRAVPLLLCGLALASLTSDAGGQDSLESELLSLINGGRNSPLAAHSGLRMAGREHSQEMADAGGLNHDGADGRINGAPPDPAESNGPPDDGFTGTWCENVAYVRGAPQEEVAERMYRAWTDSPSHERCMNHPDMTAAGVGMYYETDTNTWWATLESVVDQTLPGTAPAQEPTPTPTPTPTPVPVRTEPPEPTERPEPVFASPTQRSEPTERPEPTRVATRAVDDGRSGAVASRLVAPVEQPADSAATLAQRPASPPRPVSRVLAVEHVPTAAHTTVGWAELASTLAVIALAGELLRRLTRRPPTDA